MHQRRWMELLSDYEWDIRYHAGKVNVVADALSRKESITPRSKISVKMSDHNDFATNMIEGSENNNGWIEESEPEEDLTALVNSPQNLSDMNGAYYDGQTIVLTAFPSMFPTGFYISEITGEHHPIPGRELPTPPSPIMLFSETTPDAPNWSWLADTLQFWRNEGNLPTFVGSSSEPLGPPYEGLSPHYSIPPIISHVSQQDNRLDLIEDALNEMPGSDAFEHLETGIKATDKRVATVVSAFEHNAEILCNVREVTINLRDRLNDARTPSLEWRVRNLERDLDGFQGRLEQIETTAYGTAAFYDHIARTGRIDEDNDQ